MTNDIWEKNRLTEADAPTHSDNAVAVYVGTYGKYNDGSIDEVNLNKIRCIYGKYDFNPQGFHCETKLGKNHCKIDFKTGNIYFCKRCMDKKECIGNLFENKYNFDITDDICISKTCNFCNRGDKI